MINCRLYEAFERACIWEEGSGSHVAQPPSLLFLPISEKKAHRAPDCASAACSPRAFPLCLSALFAGPASKVAGDGHLLGGLTQS